MTLASELREGSKRLGICSINYISTTKQPYSRALPKAKQ